MEATADNLYLKILLYLQAKGLDGNFYSLEEIFEGTPDKKRKEVLKELKESNLIDFKEVKVSIRGYVTILGATSGYDLPLYNTLLEAKLTFTGSDYLYNRNKTSTYYSFDKIKDSSFIIDSANAKLTLSATASSSIQENNLRSKILYYLSQYDGDGRFYSLDDLFSDVVFSARKTILRELIADGYIERSGGLKSSIVKANKRGSKRTSIPSKYRLTSRGSDYLRTYR